MKKIVLLILILTTVSFASTAAAFLDNGISARSESLGRSFCALADDTDAFYYNPAGYADQPGPRVNTMFSKMQNVNDVYYLGGSFPFFGGMSALNFFMTSVGGIPVTSYVNGRIVEDNESFEYSSKAAFFSYAQKLPVFLKALRFSANDPELQKVAIGFNLKYIQEAMYYNKAKGYGLDLGLLYRLDEMTTLGFTVLNLVEPVMTWDTASQEKNIVERTEKLGLAYRFSKNLIISGELTFKKHESLSGLGIEYWLNELLAMRGGMSSGLYALGFGLNYVNFNFDYVYLLPADELRETTHKFSLGYLFGGVTKIKAANKLAETPASPESLGSAAMMAVEITDKSTEKVISLQKKNIVLVDDKVKCFYKLQNKSQGHIVVRVVSKLIVNNQEVDSMEKDEEILPGGSLVEMTLNADKKYKQAKVKTFVKYPADLLMFVDEVK